MWPCDCTTCFNAQAVSPPWLAWRASEVVDPSASPWRKAASFDIEVCRCNSVSDESSHASRSEPRPCSKAEAKGKDTQSSSETFAQVRSYSDPSARQGPSNRMGIPALLAFGASIKVAKERKNFATSRFRSSHKQDRDSERHGAKDRDGRQRSRPKEEPGPAPAGPPASGDEGCRSRARLGLRRRCTRWPRPTRCKRPTHMHAHACTCPGYIDRCPRPGSPRSWSCWSTPRQATLFGAQTLAPPRACKVLRR